MDSEKVLKAKKFAIKAHKDTNHFYDGFYYDYHLQMVVDVAEKFIHLIDEKDREDVLCAAWLHDTIEDARLTYNDIKYRFGEVIAEYVYALTNEKGRTRKERADSRYYRGIASYRDAAFVKICDRVANVEYSFLRKSGMFMKYKEEHDNFYDSLYETGHYQELWDHLAKKF